MTLREFVQHLTSRGYRSVQRSGRYEASCPVCEGKDGHHLYVERGDRQPVVVTCHRSGCDRRDILKALGLEVKDICRDGQPRASERRGLTVDRLAAAKQLPPEFLRRLGVEDVLVRHVRNEKNDREAVVRALCDDGTWNAGIDAPWPEVLIRYHLEDGHLAPRHRRRYAVSGKRKHCWARGKGRPVPYGLDRLQAAREARRLIIVEGETDCWTLWFHGYPALGLPGAGTAGLLRARYLRGVEKVYVIQEPDEAGRNFATSVAKKLGGNWSGELYRIQLNGAKDPSALHCRSPEGFRDAFNGALAAAERVQLNGHCKPDDGPSARETPCAAAGEGERAGEPGKRIPQAELLIRLCEAEVKEFVRDQFDVPHVLLPCGDHDELRPTSSGQFRELWLARRFRQVYGKPPGSEALRQARREVDALCCERPRRTLFNRVAWLGDGYGGRDLWYDLSDDEWRAVRITADGWTVEPAPATFRRFKHEAPQVPPTTGGRIHDLFRFCNIDEADRCLFLATLVSYMVPDIPHPILILRGRHGSAKSSTNRFIKDLIDPTHSSNQTGSATQKPPKEEDACAHVFYQHWVVPLDNISKMPEWFADVLCRASTGEAISQRKLYTDEEDHLRAYKRCCTLSLTNMPAWRGDLIDRSVIIELTRPGEVIDEETLGKNWMKAKPAILGALLDVAAAALRSIAEVDTTGLPRMADFAKWGRASAQACGYGAATFNVLYERSIKTKWEDSVELDSFAQKVVEMVKEAEVENGRHKWEGTAEQLYQRVALKSNDHERAHLPQSGRSTSSRLENMAPALESVGVTVARGRESGTGKRLIRITCSAERNSRSGQDALPGV